MLIKFIKIFFKFCKNSIGFLNPLLHEAYILREIQEDVSKFVITSSKNTSVTNFYTKEKHSFY